MIRRHLHLTPTPLPQILWDLLRKHCAIRRFREEVIHRFQRCVPVDVPDTLFARTVDRTLQAAFGLFPQTDPVRVVFVHADHDTANLVYSADEATLYVQDRWLSVHGAHRNGACAALRLAHPSNGEQAYFFCDHVVEELYGLAIELMSHEHQMLHQPFQLPSHARDHVRDRLRQMPRMVQAIPSPRGGIRVTWTDGEPAAWAQCYGAQIAFRVSLHEEDCGRDPTRELLHQEPQSSAETEDPDTRCSCPTTTTTYQQSVVDFDHLDDSKKYFPVVSRTETGAFYGISPPPIQAVPPVDEDPNQEEPASTVRETTDKQTQTSPTDERLDGPGPVSDACWEAEEILSQWRLYQDPASSEGDKNSRLERAFRRLRPTHNAPEVRPPNQSSSQPLTSK